MSSNPAVRPLRLPPANLAGLNIPKTRLPSRTRFKVHRADLQARFFSLNPTHRFSHSDGPYKVLYAGSDVETCLFERFGDEVYDGDKALPFSVWRSHAVSKITCPAFHVCDLTNARTLSALQVDLGTLMNDELDLPQKWGLAIQAHPANFQGIKYRSRFNGNACLALFDRDGMSGKLKEVFLAELVDSDETLVWIDRHRISLF